MHLSCKGLGNSLATHNFQGAVLNRDANGNLARRDGFLDQLGQLLGIGNGNGGAAVTTITTTVIPGATQVVENPVPTAVTDLPPAPPPVVPATTNPDGNGVGVTVIPATTNANGNGVGVSTIPIPSSLLPTTTFVLGE